MPPPNTTNWIRLGLLALPVYGLLTFLASLHPQPDPSNDYEAWARFVTTNSYVLNHLLGSTLGLIFAIFGVFALGAYLAKGRTGRLGLVAMLITVTGNALFLMLIGVSAFAAPAQGQAYLAGIEEVAQLDPGIADEAQAATFLVVIVLLFVGNMLLSVAVWHYRPLPLDLGHRLRRSATARPEAVRKVQGAGQLERNHAPARRVPIRSLRRGGA